METATKCSICNAPKAPKNCSLCQASICKNCQIQLRSDAFLYRYPLPEKLSHLNYCARCYDEHVAAELAHYEVLAEQAKNVYFLTDSYLGYVRVLQSHTERISIPDCDDRREIILKMAYQAAELGYNALIKSRVESRSVNIDGYHSSRWKASALPAKIDEVQLERSSLRRI
jgi:hypothetical protein